ncbi:TPA: hypothetical protein IAA82_01585 [Candidatus Galligastranaerophilus gallistercoris]|nr:hypothetical protein [Candidatus Galligastranaerophilus gallistercoris]
MKLFTELFKGGKKKKTTAPNTSIRLYTSRKPKVELSIEEIEAKKKEEELLNKIKSGLENLKMHRENKTELYFSPVLKYLHDETLKLEEKIKPEVNDSLTANGKYRELSFENQYALGQFVVSL